MARAVPPGSCRGCLLEHATEPCPLHRAAADLLDACRNLLELAATVEDHDLADQIRAEARTAIARAEGRAP
jgi:hypothetical protein